MSGGSADKTYAKRQRQLFETVAGERAFKIAAREAVSGSGSRGRQPLEEAKVVTYLVAEALDQQLMLRIMGEQKEKLFPLS
jgi:hypothetical protein